MTWVRGYIGTVLMALLLAVLTWSWLYSESTASRPLDFVFQPQSLPDIAQITYRLDKGHELGAGDKFRIEIVGPRSVVDALRSGFTCSPVLDKDAFSAPAGSHTLVLTREHFQLPSTVQIKSPPTLAIEYQKFVTREVELVADPGQHVADAPPRGLEVVTLRVSPLRIRVRVPALRADGLDRLPIQKIRVSDRASSFETIGRLDAEGVEPIDEFLVHVALRKKQIEWVVRGVTLHLSGPPETLQRLQFKNHAPISIRVAGDPEFQSKLAAEHLYAFVCADKLQLAPEAGQVNLKDFGCLVRNPDIEPFVRIVAIMDEQEPQNREVAFNILPARQP